MRGIRPQDHKKEFALSAFLVDNIFSLGGRQELMGMIEYHQSVSHPGG